VPDDSSSNGGPGSGGDFTLTNVGPVRPGDADENFSLKPTFRPGEVVAGRYEIEGFLARGGMGEVYRVFDRELGESVALKTILPRSADDPMTLDRFRREIQIARKVSHRNVCRIFDLGRHVQPDGQDVVFLTMELLEGVSLRARLRESTMAPDEAVDVVRQLCEGLGAAHRKGIVHRDLKPSNIFLVPEDEGHRVVIADFGLARSEIKPDGQLTVTGTGEILGTPAYMSPEQIEGKPATTSSDIYSLGLVMYETLTGAQPFEGESAFQIALNKLREAPTSPSTRVRGLPPLWDRTILRCLEKKPEDRFASVEDIPPILSGERRLRHRPLKALARKPGVVIAVAAVVLVGLGAVLMRFFSDGGREARPAAVELRRSVAVLGFENLKDDPANEWISTLISDYLTTELAAGGEVRTVPGESVTRARSQLGIDRVSTLGPETLSSLRELLAMDLVVLGSFAVLDDGDGAMIRLDTRVQDVEADEIMILESVTGRPEELTEIVNGAARQIRRRVGLDVAEESLAGGAFPTEARAARLYSEGVMRLRSFDAAGAVQSLERAAEVEPDSPLIWLELANARAELGYGVAAVEAAERALDFSGELGQELRLRIEGRYQLLATRYDDAVDTFRSLWLVYPDTLDYGLFLAEAQAEAGEVEASLETTAELKNLPDPLNRDPRIDLAEAVAAGQLGDTGRQAAAAERVVEASRQMGSSLLEAEGRLELGAALRSSGELDRALVELEEARRLAETFGNRAGEAGATYSIAITLLGMGRTDEATDEANLCLEIAREIDDRTTEGDVLNLIGSIRLRQGDLAGALEVFTEALDLQRTLSNERGEADALNNLGLVQMWSGDFRSASDSFNQLLVRYRELGNPHKEAQVVMNLARINAARGDLDGARSRFEEAAGLYRVQDNAELLAEALFGLGEVLLTQGDLDGARTRHEEALELREEHGLASVSESEFALGGLALAEAGIGVGSYGEAVEALSGSVATFAEKNRPALEADALNYLAEAQIGLGELDAAMASLERIRSLGAASNSFTLMVVEINEARIEARSGRSADAEAILEEVIAEARRQSIYGVELEARLVMGEVAAGDGRTDEARRRLTDVEREANARGWTLVADRASAARKTLDPG
jgi:tetratricopeptide (TPR) repeat protein/TolB-like protein